jgi:hypothetical protein
MKFNTIVGQAARGDNFLPRPGITSEITNKLDSGSNLLLVAPRRVGKSSILLHLLDNPPAGTVIIYYTSESVNSENEFFRKLFDHLVEKLKGIEKYRKKIFTGVKTLYRSLKIIGKDGIELDHDASINYYDEVVTLLKNINEESEKIVILIDEFAETIENIIRDENVNNAIRFLETKRELRQMPEIYRKVQFIYAGSIGLENVAEKINGSKHINDIVPIQVLPLVHKEGEQLIEMITAKSGVKFPQDSIDYLFEKIEWWIPFYFQLILDEIAKILSTENSNTIKKEIIDASINNILKRNIYFQNWFSRLRRVFERNEFSFIKYILNTISEKTILTSAEISDAAIKYKVDEVYNNLINTLKHDGYINNDVDPKVYTFNSPLLREWWYRNVAN